MCVFIWLSAKKSHKTAVTIEPYIVKQEKLQGSSHLFSDFVKPQISPFSNAAPMTVQKTIIIPFAKSTDQQFWLKIPCQMYIKIRKPISHSVPPMYGWYWYWYWQWYWYSIHFKAKSQGWPQIQVPSYIAVGSLRGVVLMNLSVPSMLIMITGLYSVSLILRSTGQRQGW